MDVIGRGTCGDEILAAGEAGRADDEVLPAGEADDKLLPALEAGGRALASEADDEVLPACDADDKVLAAHAFASPQGGWRGFGV